MPIKDRRPTWWVLVDHPAWAQPQRVERCRDEAEARALVAALNRLAPDVPDRPLYWAEFMDTASVLDTEGSEREEVSP